MTKHDTSVTLCGLKLDNPVVPASGTFGFGREFAEFYDINILGSLSFKGTTREARFGNPTPRIAECGASGMINAVGLQNPGIHAVIENELPNLKKIFHKPVIANISGFSVEEYAYCCELIDKEPQVGIIEVNVSCPNVRHGGMSFGTHPDAAAEVTRAVKAVTTKPVFIKLSPNVTDIAQIALACQEAADGICLINTMLGMRIDTARRRPVIANQMGGFSVLVDISCGGAYGVPGSTRLLHSHYGLWRRKLGRRRHRNDDGGGNSRASRCNEFGRPVYMQNHYRRTSCRNGTPPHRPPLRHYRHSEPITPKPNNPHQLYKPYKLYKSIQPQYSYDSRCNHSLRFCKCRSHLFFSR